MGDALISARPFKAVIIQNYSTEKPWGGWTIDSIKDNIRRTVPDAQVSVCHAQAGDALPDPSTIDLIVLTGGVYNLLEPTFPPWVVGIQSLVKQVAKAESGPSLIGICWGHQAVNKALGGEIGWLRGGARVGVEKIALTASGKEFFGRDSLMLHKYHRRVVSVPAPGLEALGERNEIFINRAKGIVTFQGHPEMSYEISKSLVDNDTGSYKPGTDQDRDLGIQLSSIESSHDGSVAWDRIMEQVVASRKH